MSLHDVRCLLLQIDLEVRPLHRPQGVEIGRGVSLIDPDGLLQAKTLLDLPRLLDQLLHRLHTEIDVQGDDIEEVVVGLALRIGRGHLQKLGQPTGIMPVGPACQVDNSLRVIGLGHLVSNLEQLVIISR